MAKRRAGGPDSVDEFACGCLRAKTGTRFEAVGDLMIYPAQVNERRGSAGGTLGSTCARTKSCRG